MIDEELFKLEREAEKRVHEARDREIDRGGSGSARRASEAMNAPMLEVANIRKMRRQLIDKRMEIDHQTNLLRRANRDPDLPSDVKRYRIDQAEMKLAELAADYSALEAEAEQKSFPASARFAESRIYHRDGVWLPARPEREPRDAERPDLPAIPRLKPETVSEFPLPRPRPVSAHADVSLPIRPRPRPDRAPVLDYETEPERSSPGDLSQDRFPEKWAAKGWGGPRGPYAVPTLTDKIEREDNLKADKPARFVVREKPDANTASPADETPWEGWRRVREYDRLIIEAARKHHVDPDLIRAVIWTEGARFHRGGLDEAADALGLSRSSLPMNIQREDWASLIGKKPADLKNASDNIEAGAELLRRIAERIEDPTPEKIGSVWNYAGRETVSEYGAYLGRIYREKPWLGPQPAGPEFDPFAAP